MNLMIIDDEPLVRQGLQSLIDWNSYGFTVLTEAGNGEEGLEKVLRLLPDIVLLDIRMPGLSGVELMRRAREEGFRGRFILLTGYADFEYAREGIKYGATDYLLKPVDEEELLQAVLKAEQSLLLENVMEIYGDQTLSQLRASLLEGLLLGRLPVAGTRLGLGAEGQPFKLVLIACAKEKIPQVCAALRESLGNACLHCALERRVAAVLQGRSAIAAHERVARVVAARDPEALLFLSPATEQAALLPSLYAQCAELADDSWFFRRPGALEFDCRELQAYGPEEPPGEEALVQGLQARLDGLDAEGLAEELQALEKKLRSRCLGRDDARNLLMALYRRLDRHLRDCFPEGAGLSRQGLQAIGLAESLADAVASLQEELARSLDFIRSGSGADIRQRLLQYIDNNFHKSLRLKDLAVVLGYDSAYLGKLLKAETGLSFNAYLEKVRLQHARRFLLEGLSVGEVAQRCGFGSVEYFSNKFRRAEGCSPSRYRQEAEKG